MRGLLEFEGSGARSEMENCLLGLYEKSMPISMGLDEKLKIASDSGFDFLEISIDETEEKLARLKWSTEEKCDLVNSMCRTALPIKTLCLSAHRKFPIGSVDTTTRQRGMEIMADAIDFASCLGIRIIQLAGYDCYYEPSTETSKLFFLENLKRCAEMAATKGVLLAFETMETEFMNTVQKAMHYVRLVDSPYLQIYPDLGNITNAAMAYGTSVQEDLVAGRGHLVALHLKESLPGQNREIPYGTGHVDFDGGIRMAQKLGVGLYLAEFWDTGKEDWRDQIRHAHDFLRSKL